MSDARHPSVFTISPHRAFADALAAGLIARFGRADTGLARGLLVVPNNRAVRAITDAFVRRSQGGLLLPRIVPIGDEELETQLGGALEPIAVAAEPIPPAIAPLERLLALAGIVEKQLPGEVDAAEAIRLAEELAATLDQMLIEQVDPKRLRDIAGEVPDLSLHWQKSLKRLELILEEWPRLLAARGRIDLSDRRNRILEALAKRWRVAPPDGFVVAAGITTGAPAVAALLRRIAFLANGEVVLPALDLGMPEGEWQALGPHQPDPVTGFRKRPVETHPQFHLKLLLDRMGVGRGEVRSWRWGGGRDAPAVRARAISHAMTPAQFTDKWQQLAPAERRLSGIRALELADPAEEAQTAAIAIREALERPGQTVALVTPDRTLARRVVAHLQRWAIEADDSAGRPLSRTPAGALLLLIAAAIAERFAPVPLLALLKHPLVRYGEPRLAWLDGVRLLDRMLRGPRPGAGLHAIGRHLAQAPERERDTANAAAQWWEADALPLLEPLEQTASAPDLSSWLAALRDAADRLCGAELWAGPAGRAAAELFADLEAAATGGAHHLEAASLVPLLERLMDRVAVRPPFGQHPRVFIWGLLEARLQRADLVILAGLNEAVWPALPSPDPWLAPKIRHELGLPGLERRIGLAAHDFATALGAPHVLVTRARRDARSPTIASRFWLRLEAMTGGLARAPDQRKWARAIDFPGEPRPARRPKPAPPAAQRPTRISVTEVDRLKADPYAFYARRMLRLSQLDQVDADPSPAWRGSAVHKVLETWMQQDDCDPSRLRARAEALLAQSDAHPLLRALWEPRLLEAIDWIAGEVAGNRAEGRRPLRAEVSGKCEIAGVVLEGRADRIDLLADGGLAIVDYKTGGAPTAKAVREGFAMQLGLLGLIAEHGGFDDIEGVPAAFEYWSLARKSGSLGYVASPTSGKNGIEPSEFTDLAAANFIKAAQAWLTGDAPFTAKLHPEHAPYGEYDQLMRFDEWYGNEAATDRDEL